MALEYSDAEEAVRQRFLTHYAQELNEKSIQAGDIDVVMTEIIEHSAKFGCLLEFAGGRDPGRDSLSFTGGSSPRGRWTWTITGMFFIRFVPGEIEGDLRGILNKLPTVFDADPRLSGAAVIAKIVRVDTAEPSEVAGIPVYWLPFVVDVWVQ